MPPRKQIKLAEMKVGILVIVALTLLAALILQQSWGVDWFTKSVKVKTYLPDVGGLKSGAPVWLAGIEIGRVRKVTIVPPQIYAGNRSVFLKIDEAKRQIALVDPKLPHAIQNISDLQDKIRDLKLDIRMVEVQLDIRPQFMDRISKDSEVSIESRGLIGDSFIDITPGTYGVPPSKVEDFCLIEGLEHPGFREIMTGANDVMANFGVLSEQFKNITKKINPDKVGSGVASAIKDAQEALQKAGQTFSQATLLIKDLHSNKGTFGRITTDPKLYERLVESMERLNSIADKIQNGSGTAGKFINDPALYESANKTLQKTEQVMSRIEKGEGTLGKLSKDAELYERSKIALDRFATFIEEVEQGKGTLGKLLKDPSLYNNLNQSTAEIAKLIYDIRQDPKKYLTIRFHLF